MGRLEEKKAVKQRKLLDAAAALFLDRGTANTSIDDIVLKAGLGKGTFYLYFRDKQDIHQKLVRIKVEELFERTLGELDAEEFFAVDYIIAFIDRLINELTRNKRLLMFIHKSLSLGILPEALSEASGEHMNNFVDIFQARLKDCGIKSENPTISLFMITELVAGTAYHSILHGQPLPINEYKPYLYKAVRCLMRAL